jgi:hypothetical protein
MARNHEHQSPDTPHDAELLEDMRSLGWRPAASSAELTDLRAVERAERADFHHRVLDAITETARADLRSPLEDVRRKRQQRQRQIAELLPHLDAAANRDANEEMARLHRIRERYRERFGGKVAGPGDPTQLKLRDVSHTYSDVTEPRCEHLDSWEYLILPAPTVGPDITVSAVIAPSTDSPGMWLHPSVDIIANSCDEMTEARTYQEVAYQLAAPATTFGVESVRVDLIANGTFRSHLGDPPGWFTSASSLYVHTHVEVTVVLGQQIGGAAQLSPVVSDEIFTARGNVDPGQVRAVLSGQTYPTNLFIGGADIGAGTLHCLLQVACTTVTIGSGARVRLDFGAEHGHGIFAGGVALLGAYG